MCYEHMNIRTLSLAIVILEISMLLFHSQILHVKFIIMLPMVAKWCEG